MNNKPNVLPVAVRNCSMLKTIQMFFGFIDRRHFENMCTASSIASAEDYLRVIVCALRKKVAPLGIKIGTVRQLGYYAVNRALMLDVLAREAEANCFPTPYARRTRDTRGESHVHA